MENVMKVTAVQMVKIILHAHEKNKTLEPRKQFVPAFFGAPGMGKSFAAAYAAHVIAKSEGKRHVVNAKIADWVPGNYCETTRIMAQVDKLDVNGLPHIENNMTVFTTTEMFPEQGEGMIILDEFPAAAMEMQVAMQDVLQFKRIGTHIISKDVMFVVLGNRPEDNSGVQYMSMALRDRLQIYEVVRSSNEEWLKMMEDSGHPIDTRLAGWFLSIGAPYAYSFDPDKEQFVSGTFRSSEQASIAITGVTDPLMMRLLVGGHLGEAAAVQFMSFLSLREQIDLKRLMHEPSMILKHKDHPGMLYSIFVGLKELVVDQPSFDGFANVAKTLNVGEFSMFFLSCVRQKVGVPRGVSFINGHGDKEFVKRMLELLKPEGA